MRASAFVVLIVDDDDVRSASLARIVRLLGAVPAQSRRLELSPEVDVLFVDDDAFDGGGAEIARLGGRISPLVFRCLAARWTRFAEVNGAADYVLVKPLTAASVLDVLHAAHARHAAATAHP